MEGGNHGFYESYEALSKPGPAQLTVLGNPLSNRH